MKSTFSDIGLFWVLPHLYKAGDNFFHLFFNSALDWLSFNNRNNEFSACDYAYSAFTLSNHKV